MSINKRVHRADLVISLRAMAGVFVVALVIVLIAVFS